MLDAEGLLSSPLNQQVMETSGPRAAFKGRDGLVQAAAIQYGSGKKLARNPAAGFKTADIVDELNDSGRIDRK